MVWRTRKPNEADRVKNLGKVIRDNKTALDTAMQKSMYWSDSEVSAGMTHFSITTGSARAFYDTASRISISLISSSVTGRLYLTSDTSRLYMMSSVTSSLVGSRRMIVQDSVTTANPVGGIKRVQFGAWPVDSFGGGSSNATTFTGYGSAPTLEITPICKTVDDMYSVGIEYPIRASGFTLVCTWHGNTGGADPDECGAFWRAEGYGAV